MRQLQAMIVRGLLVVTIAAAFAGPARGVIRLDTATRNTGTPADAGQASALSLVGQIGSFSGTPIAPNLFVAAQHATGLGAPLVVGGHAYNTIAYSDVAGTDLRVFQIDTSGGTFAHYASLYDASASGSEAGKPLFVAGRGSQRGPDYTFNGETRGYYWGVQDGVQSWGAGSVDEVVHDDHYGDLVSFGFTSAGLALTGGDSGGALFVKVGDSWELAGVNLGADGSWSRAATDTYESASIFDARGLYVGTLADHQSVPTDQPISGASYASSISSNRAAINAIFLATGNAALVPEPTTLATIAGCALLALRRRRAAK